LSKKELIEDFKISFYFDLFFLRFSRT